MKPNTLYIILATLVIAAGAYWYFFTGTGNQPPLSASAAASPAQVQFETLVSELQPISFNTDIFSDPRFSALVDISTPISPESSGRLDPLAPFSSSGGTIPTANGTTTKTSALGGN
ncbi:MAG TPA: hypothetical protein VNF51_02045 [Candidatus Paceibacterota bacterium]|nr:hypothetical protein [Candidatus Paceibacterota bacterium]